MSDSPYDYTQVGKLPKLLGFCLGWYGQKATYLASLAVINDNRDRWLETASEVGRLIVIYHAWRDDHTADNTPDVLGSWASLWNLIDNNAWWDSDDALYLRAPDEAGRDAREDFLRAPLALTDAPFFPLLAPRGTDCPMGGTVTRSLSYVVYKTPDTAGNLELVRLGILMAGLCYRITPVRQSIIMSVLDDLAALDMTDLAAENQLRHAMDMPELAPDRSPQWARRLHEEPGAPPTPGLMSPQSDFVFPNTDQVELRLDGREELVLNCVFKKFNLPPPPQVSDADQQPCYEDMKKEFRAFQLPSPESGAVPPTAEQAEQTEESRGHANIFRKNGDVWEVDYGGVGSTMVKASVGMTYIALLIKAFDPTGDVGKLPCLKLEGQRTGLSPNDTEGAPIDKAENESYDDSTPERGWGVKRDEMIDQLTVCQCMERKRKLEEALQTEKDPAKIVKYQKEHSELEAYLGSGLKLNQKSRSFVNENDKARLRVTKAIGTAMDNIAAHHQTAAAHFRNTINTGAYCSYTPETPVDWDL
jgi:hypothetical protein